MSREAGAFNISLRGRGRSGSGTRVKGESQQEEGNEPGVKEGG